MFCKGEVLSVLRQRLCWVLDLDERRELTLR